MRKLAGVCVSLACAVFLSYYILPLGALPGIALCSLALAVLCFLTLGLGAYLFHWNRTLRYAEEWDGAEQTLRVCVMETPQEYDRYTRVHVRRTEAPKLDLMLYDYRGLLSGDDALLNDEGEEKASDQGAFAGPLPEPGALLTVTAKLRRADLRYGERNDNYVSKDIYLTGTLHAVDVLTETAPTLRTLAARLSGRLSAFAAGFFSQ